MLCSLARAVCLGVVVVLTGAQLLAAPQRLTWNEEAQLAASDGAADDRLGRGVSISGDTAVVGAHRADHSGFTNAGAAYVFVRSGTDWAEQAKLVASSPATADAFGNAVAISGDTILVGVALDDIVEQGDEGSAYVFVRSGTVWTQQAKLLASDGLVGDRFGNAVGLSGDCAVVGALSVDQARPGGQGAAYVFERVGTSWEERAKLFASDASPADHFGADVCICGDTILVGAHLADSAGVVDAGAAYVFVRSGTDWIEEAKLFASDPGIDDRFGRGLSVSGDTALVGSFKDDHSGLVDVGSAYVFARTGTLWSEEAKLVVSDPTNNRRMAKSVFVSGERAVIGSSRDRVNNNGNAGSAYVFGRAGTTWAEQAKLVPGSSQTGARFGISVAIDGNRVIAGALLYDGPAANNLGTAYAFDVPDGCVTCVSYCTAGSSAAGCQATLSALGAPSASAPDGFVALAEGVEGFQRGLFFFGSSGRKSIPWGGASYYCVMPPVKRGGLHVPAGSPGLCNAGWSQDLNTLWFDKPRKNPGAGAVVQLQLWYSDPANTSGTLSDALEFTMAP